MIGWCAKTCSCFAKKRTVINDEYLDSDRRSVTDIELEDAPKKRPPKDKACCKFQRQIPRRLLNFFRREEENMTKIEKTIKASLLIQKWFRRYMARLEFRRRYTWTIFQTLEYAGEQDQVKLYNFFNALLQHIPQQENDTDSMEIPSYSSFENCDFEDESPDEEYMEPEDKRKLAHYSIDYPYTEKSIINLIEVFRKHRHYKLPPKNVAEIFRRSIVALKKQPNVNVASISGYSKQITICGDLHGKFEDLLVILHKNGVPSADNPYVFNGDFVDRGKRGLEVLLILLLLFLAIPGAVYLNRGNHEDIIMNQRYGFIKEVQSKYKKNSEKFLKLIEGVYRYLPLGTIINTKVLVVHGGISDGTDLDMLRSLDRERYVSLLRPPICSESSAPGADTINKVEWKQVFDILWSDPQTSAGCIPNTLRGAGTYFGPDITKKFLEDNKLSFLVRSHECKADGYEICHNNKVITIFSASNYYEVGSNTGAYLVIRGYELSTQYVQFTANSTRKKLTVYQKMGLIESGAAKELKMQIINNREKIEEAFLNVDPDLTGYISITEWCVILERCTGLQVPWRMLKDKLVQIDEETNRVKYMTTFDTNGEFANSVQGGATVTETLYRNKISLEAIFRIIDKDSSGYISLDEFLDACSLIQEHMPCPMTHDQMEEICRLMDINKDGKIDINEFLESFRIVDPESRRKNLPCSPVSTKERDHNGRTANSSNNSNKSESVSSPSVSPVSKPFNLLPKIREESNGSGSSSNFYGENVSVTVHTPPRKDKGDGVPKPMETQF